MSVVGHDDQQCYRLMQEGLAAGGNDWVNLHRDYRPDEQDAHDLTVNGTSELPMRNQFRAWASFMADAASRPRNHAIHLSRGPAAGREALGCVVCAVHRGRALLGAADTRPAGRRDHTSLAYEDKLLLRLRIERLRRRPPSQHPESWSQHVLQAPEIEAADGDGWMVRTAFHYSEALVMYANAYGVTLHRLVRQDGALRIRLKRVELLNCDAALPSIQLFL